MTSSRSAASDDGVPRRALPFHRDVQLYRSHRRHGRLWLDDAGLGSQRRKLMTLKARGTRRIVVDDIAYRWTVAPNDEPGMAIVVEEAAAPAQRMVAWVEHGCIISPALVHRAIVRALASGWDPRKPGPEVVFRVLGVPPGEIVSWPPVS